MRYPGHTSTVPVSSGVRLAPERDVFKTLTKNTAIPSAITPEPIVETRLYHSQSPPS